MSIVFPDASMRVMCNIQINLKKQQPAAETKPNPNFQTTCRNILPAPSFVEMSSNAKSSMLTSSYPQQPDIWQMAASPVVFQNTKTRAERSVQPDSQLEIPELPDNINPDFNEMGPQIQQSSSNQLPLEYHFSAAKVKIEDSLCDFEQEIFQAQGPGGTTTYGQRGADEQGSGMIANIKEEREGDDLNFKISTSCSLKGEKTELEETIQVVKVCAKSKDVIASRTSTFVRPITESDVTAQECSVCRKKFDNIAWLQAHLENSHVECERCTKMFHSRTHLSIHQANGIECILCKQLFCVKDEWRVHWTKVHGLKLTARCGCVFDSIDLYNEHEFQLVRCRMCQLAFCTESERKKHWNEVHCEKLKCSECSCLFHRVELLNKHMEMHSATKCSECGKEFKNKRSLENHQRRLCGAYQCNLCGKKFKEKYSLDEHRENEHKGEGCYKCDVCNKQFWMKWTLNQHKLTHTVETPHQCKICGKSFQMSSALVLHFKTHLNERKYTCTHCNAVFRTKCHLTKHMQLHDPRETAECKICGKTFKSNVYLKGHMELHQMKKTTK